MLLVSCIEEPESPQIDLVETSEIAQVKVWFEENKTKLRLPERGSNFRTESQELILPFFEKEPDWDQFHHYYFPDGREVFEISLENENIYIPVEKESGGVKEGVEFFQNILFVKYPSEPRFDPMIIRYYPEETSSNRDFKEISYQMIDEKWSGWIDLFTYDEHYVMGYKVDQGRLTHTRTIQKEMENGRKSAIEMENKDVVYRCELVATDWYDGRTGEYLNTTWAQNCEIGEGGGTYVYTSEGGSGERDPATDGGGSTCSSCYDPPELPEPKLTITLDKSIKENARARCIVSKLALSSFVNKIAEFTDTEGAAGNSILKLASLPDGINGHVDKINGNYVITINSSNLDRPDLLVARTMFHELVHAEIYRALSANGITPLDNNFARNFDSYVFLRTPGDAGDQHHAYMAEQLLYKMGMALMDFHKTHMLDDYAKLANYMNYPGGYPKGIPVDFYVNLFWEGLQGTKAFDIMAKKPGVSTGKSSFEKYEDDNLNAEKLTTPCGN